MNCDELNILELSDIHLGHHRTYTHEIIESLDELIPWNSETAELDMIILAGDVFDRLLNLPADEVMEIRMWVYRLLKMCKHYDIVLVVLEGTPSHDWKQSKIFDEINEFSGINAELKYVDTLSIQRIERFDLTMLCVPDEWLPETDDVWKEVVDLLHQHQLDKVDIAVMHGAFSYQLPAHVTAPTHVPERYLGIVRYLIYIGHVHQHSVYKRIVSAGSTDRLKHNEEEPKGIVRTVIRKNGDNSIKFIKNTSAKIFETITCTGKNVDKVLKDLTKRLASYPDDSHIRIKAGVSDGILESVPVLKERFPNLNFTSARDEEKVGTTEAVVNLKDNYQPIAITPKNIKTLLLERLKEKGHGSQELALAENLLDDTL